MKRIFEKFFNRSMPLITVQYWYLGERYGLYEMTEHAMHFNPLFIYNKDKGIDVYYDMNTPATYIAPLFEYFRKNNFRYDEEEKRYKENGRKIMKLADRKDPRDFKEIFELIASIWPMIAVSVVLGRLKDEDPMNGITERAYNLRFENDKLEYSIADLLTELAGKIAPEFKNYVNFLLFEEVVNPEKISIDKIKARMEGYVFFEDRVYTNVDIDNFQKKHNIILTEEYIETERDEKIIKGQTACAGKAMGKAKIIFNLEDLEKVNKGDVLVASMTTPQFMPALRKAVAFITDEGGITCHAAIVSREMKKPCVIGTKIATKVLKDGDEVEVDAENGIVKIIK